MRPGREPVWARPAAAVAFLVLVSLVLAGCGGGTGTATDDDPAQVRAAVDLTGVEVEMHQAPG